MNPLSPMLWVLLLNLGTIELPPNLDVQVLLGSSRPQSKMLEQAYTSPAIKKVFIRNGLKYFYLLNETTLTFSQKGSETEVLVLPNDRTAHFTYRGAREQQHAFDFWLPDYNVKAHLLAPTERTFYQAGIKHPNGMLILKIRVRSARK